MDNKSYANRDTEFNCLFRAVYTNKNIIYLKAGKACGVTSFAKECLTRLNSETVLYINTVNNSSMSHLLLEVLVKHPYRETLQKIADEKLGEKSATLLTSFLQSIPYAGTVVSNLVEKPQAVPIYTGNYSSALEEAIIHYFSSTFNNRVIIFIDAAQNLDENSHQIIERIVSNNVCIVLIITEEDDNYIKMKNYLTGVEGISSATIDFDLPHVKLIKELAIFYGYEIDTEEAEIIGSTAKKNIHRIVEMIQNYEKEGSYKFNELEKGIVLLLYICRFGLDEPTLLSLIKVSPIFSLDDFAELSEIIENLIAKNIVKLSITNGNYKVFSLDTLFHPEVERCIQSYPDKLFYSEIIFQKFSKRTIKNNIPMLQLLYDLSIQFSNDLTKNFAIQLMKAKLKNGENIEQEVVKNSMLSSDDESESIIAAIYYCKERHYGESLKWLNNSIKSHATNPDYLNLKAILLNRTRKHTEARDALYRCIELEYDAAKKNILLSFLIANYMHLNNLHAVRELYDYHRENLHETENFGYLARNAASAFVDSNVIYRAALDNFEIYKDEFGYYSTLTNWGYSMLYNGQHETSQKLLIEAEKGLMSFGKTNLHIIYNNLGIYYLLQRDLSNSFKYLNSAKSLGLNNMPKIFVDINTACLYVLCDRPEKALELIRSIEQSVISHPVDRVRQKYYINRILVEYSNGNTDLKQLFDLCMKYKDRYNPQKTVKKIETYKKLMNENSSFDINMINTLYDPCGLEYWYTDPLKVLSERVLD
ncbi:hypothetical protein [Desulfuribacillus alkaliarsenatis]|uniref:Orc1-like AAA ATPase domain-containing protein n=1 Tax=Desulfuribacillus alkaliarsenatis TaxID=766136 RepID=A0A1E5G2T5_9FIRM|nr:hypothetical protein [Desulfuribacillus alkaliarsenatis]OEF96841.1 hypothetical protein BHF68_07215 [Desulfuribacillus alkaliarsenatis]